MLVSRALAALLALALALALAAAAVQSWPLHSLHADVAQDRAAQAEADRLHERAAAQRHQEIDRATQTQIEQDRRAAAAAGGDVERLRRALVATAQDRATSATSCADDRAAVDRLAGALSACAELVADGLRAGDAIATQVTGLQASHCSQPIGAPMPPIRIAGLSEAVGTLRGLSAKNRKRVALMP